MEDKETVLRILERAAAAMPGALGIYDVARGHLVSLGRGVAGLLGYATDYIETLNATALRALVHAQDRARLDALVRRLYALGEGESLAERLRMRHADGSWRAMRVHVAVFARDTEQRPAAVLATAIALADGEGADLSETAQAVSGAGAAGDTGALAVLATLREKAEQLALVVRSTQTCWWTCELASGALAWSDECREFFAWPPGRELRLQNCLGVVHPADQQRVREVLEGALRENGPFELEFRALPPDGRECWLSVSGECHSDDLGAPLRYFGVMRDMTAQKRIDAALRESEERFRQLAETVNEIFWVLDPVRRAWLYMSPAWVRLFGSAQAQPDPGHWLAAVHPDDRERVARVLSGAAPERSFDQEYRMRTPRGTRWLRHRGVASRDADGRVTRVLGVTDDVTDHKARDAALRDDSECGDADCATIDAAAVVEQAVDRLRPLAEARGQTLVVDVAPKPMPLPGNGRRLVEAVAHLIEGAAHSAAEGGRIEIRARPRNGVAVLQVRDKEAGVSRERLDGLLDLLVRREGAPPAGNGDGLAAGLAEARRLVHAQGGTLVAESEGDGRGYCFTLRLALREGAADAEPARRSAAQRGDPAG